MSDAKFTPGPWKYGADSYGYFDFFDANGEGVINPSEWMAVSEPNIHLIAAAPELYEMLSQTAEYFSDADGLEVDEYIYRQNVRATLAKARGETNHD